MMIYTKQTTVCLGVEYRAKKRAILQGEDYLG